MGLSASQARLLSLTSRMHDIEYKAQKLEAQKLQMANKSTQVYQEYENALNSTQLQYKTIGSDGSAVYNDATYNELCAYNSSSATKFALIDTKTGKYYLSEDLISKYNAANGEATTFAQSMTGYTPDFQNTSGTSSSSATVNSSLENTDKNLTLTRKSNKTSATEQIDDKGVTLTINNLVGETSQMQYTIFAQEGLTSSATFTLLDNNRLIITGDNLIIKAAENQDDFIFLRGSNNEVYTNSGDDIVGINHMRDEMDANYIAVNSNDNTIDTGSGNDFVVNFGTNTVSMGEGVDSLYGSTTGNYSGVDNIFASLESNGVDNIVGWLHQDALGDCQTLSTLNSLINSKKVINESPTKTKGDLSNYVQISENQDGTYHVLFKNCTLTKPYADVDPNNLPGENADGDLDFELIEQAYKQIIEDNGNFTNGVSYNMGETGNNTTGDSNNFFLMSKIIYGKDYAGFAYTNETNLSKMLKMYLDGDISNLTLGTNTSIGGQVNNNLGIYNEHAYAVVGGKVDDNGQIEYIEVENPWENNTKITLDREDVLKYFPYMILVGDSYETYDTSIGTPTAVSTQEDSASHVLGINSSSSTNNNIFCNNSSYTSSGNTEYDYYYTLFQKIQSAGGYVTVPAEMQNNKKYVNNLIQGGFAYLKAFDTTKTEWYDTSIATNTSLQEITDETSLKKAEAKYEADMRQIDAKDKKYDVDIAQLETERNAIKTEIETLKTIAKDNVERTFKLFS